MRSILALLRSTWLSESSYRVRTVLSLASVLLSVIPLYFISDAIQPIAAASIRSEGGNYFGFVVLGVAAIHVVSASVGALPSAVAGNIGNGTFEAMLATRIRLPVLLAGFASYPVALGTFRALVLLGAASLAGVTVAWTQLPVVALVAMLVILCYAGIGLVATSLVILFRTSGPLITAVIGSSALLGGAYYSTSAVPGWLQALTDWVPLSYGLRAARMLLMGHAMPGDVVDDVTRLASLTLLSLGAGAVALTLALRRARKTGTLSQY